MNKPKPRLKTAATSRKPKAPYQTTPFRINIGYGVFKATASEGIIRAATVKAKREMYNPAVRENVEVYAQAYLKRKDWKWEIPDGLPELSDEAATPS